MFGQYHDAVALGVLFGRVDFSIMIEPVFDFSTGSSILSTSTTNDPMSYYSNSAFDNPKCTAQRPPHKQTRRLKPAASRRQPHLNIDPAKHHQPRFERRPHSSSARVLWLSQAPGGWLGAGTMQPAPAMGSLSECGGLVRMIVRGREEK